jgi:hypothetical protein
MQRNEQFATDISPRIRIAFWVSIQVEGKVCKLFKRMITFFMFNVVAYLLFIAAI